MIPFPLGFNFTPPEEEQFVPGIRAPEQMPIPNPMLMLAQALRPWEENVAHGTNPRGPYKGEHPQPNLEYEEMPRQPTPGVDPDDWSHSTGMVPGQRRFWRPLARPMS